MSEPEPESKPQFSFLLYGQDPYCLNYIFKVESEHEPVEPIYLEQLAIAIDILQKHRKEAEKAFLHAAIRVSRAARRMQKDQHEEIMNKEIDEMGEGPLTEN